MENDRTTIVTTSEMKCFRSCRMRWKLECVDGLKPIEEPKPLKIGTLFHYGLENILKRKCETEAAAMNCVIEYAVRTAEERGTECDYFDAYLAAEAVGAWFRDSGWRSWNIQYVEARFEVSTGYGKRIAGKIDGVILNERSETFILEHKSTSQWSGDGSEYLRNLLWDEQNTNYIFAYTRMLEDGTVTGTYPRGVFYDITEKPTIKPFKATPVSERKYTKEGSLYKAQHAEDETPEHFRERCRAWYNEKNRIHTSFVYRTMDEIRERIMEMNAVMRDMVSCRRDESYYRNPSACSILACPYRPKCLENNPDTDCLFVKKSSKHEELQ